MQILLFAFAFLIVCLGIAVIAAIPFIVSLSRHREELADAISVNTQILVNRYNAMIGPKQDLKAVPPPPKPKGPNLYQLNRGKNGPGKNDDDNKRK